MRLSERPSLHSNGAVLLFAVIEASEALLALRLALRLEFRFNLKEAALLVVIKTRPALRLALRFALRIALRSALRAALFALRARFAWKTRSLKRTPPNGDVGETRTPPDGDAFSETPLRLPLNAGLDGASVKGDWMGGEEEEVRSDSTLANVRPHNIVSATSREGGGSGGKMSTQSGSFDASLPNAKIFPASSLSWKKRTSSSPLKECINIRENTFVRNSLKGAFLLFFDPGTGSSTFLNFTLLFLALEEGGRRRLDDDELGLGFVARARERMPLASPRLSLLVLVMLLVLSLTVLLIGGLQIGAMHVDW
jgi:hypothetical protein